MDSNDPSFWVNRVQPQEIPAIAMDLFKIGKAFHLQGSPGTGKTYIGEVVAEKLAERFGLKLVKNQMRWDKGEFGLIQANMSHYESEDWMMPLINPKTSKYERTATSVLPVNDNGLFQIDEIAKKPETFRFVAQLMNEGRIGFDYFLPKNTYCMSTSNYTSDRAGAHHLHTDLINRMAIINVHPTAEGFCKHHGGELAPDIMGFLKWFPDKILTFNPKDVGEPFASPRSIFAVSQLLDTGFDPNNATNPNAYKVLRSLVGEAFTNEFQAVLRASMSLGDVDDMIKDPEGSRNKIETLKSDSSNARSQLCSLTMMLAKRCKRDASNFGDIIRLLHKIDDESAVVFTHMALQVNPKVKEQPEFAEHYERNQGFYF